MRALIVAPALLLGCGPEPVDVLGPCLASCDAQAEAGCEADDREVCATDCADPVAWCAAEWAALFECQATLEWTCEPILVSGSRPVPGDDDPCPAESEALSGCQYSHDG